jgi:hypothetical protein
LGVLSGRNKLFKYCQDPPRSTSRSTKIHQNPHQDPPRSTSRSTKIHFKIPTSTKIHQDQFQDPPRSTSRSTPRSTKIHQTLITWSAPTLNGFRIVDFSIEWNFLMLFRKFARYDIILHDKITHGLDMFQTSYIYIYIYISIKKHNISLPYHAPSLLHAQIMSTTFGPCCQALTAKNTSPKVSSTRRYKRRRIITRCNHAGYNLAHNAIGCQMSLYLSQPHKILLGARCSYAEALLAKHNVSRSTLKYRSQQISQIFALL